MNEEPQNPPNQWAASSERVTVCATITSAAPLNGGKLAVWRREADCRIRCNWFYLKTDNRRDVSLVGNKSPERTQVIHRPLPRVPDDLDRFARLAGTRDTQVSVGLNALLDLSDGLSISFSSPSWPCRL